MKTYSRSLLFMLIYAAISIFLFNMFLGNILLTLTRALFGDYFLLPYYVLSITALSAVMIFGWRIHAGREMGEEKRTYLHSIEGKTYSHSDTVSARRTDKRHRAILLAALTVSVVESLFTGIFVMIPFQFGAFWLVENAMYVRHRKEWAENRMHC